MASFTSSNVAIIAILIAILLKIPPSVQSVGVCYGRIGDNLPSPPDVVKLYISHNIGAMRLYSPDQDVLQALRGSNIELTVGVPGEVLQSLASDPNAATAWVETNIHSYWPSVSFRHIAVGNEDIPGANAQYVLPAMQNIQDALNAAGLNLIKVSTAVSSAVLGLSYPPSASEISSDALPTMKSIVQFLFQNNAPLLANIYPYFAYEGNKAVIQLAYALFTSPGTVVRDGMYNYQNLFDAQVDALYAALEKVGGSSVAIVVSESGWPSGGGDVVTTVQNAQTYHQNLVNHVGLGTPRRPGKPIETYLFAMFNEDLKPGAATEQYFGLFYPNQLPVYPINFN